MKSAIKPYIITLLLFTCGCSYNDIKVTDPKKAILGRWEEIENSLGAVTNPSGYDEYLPDSLRKTYSYADKIFYIEKYWLQDSLLFRSFKYVDPYDNSTTVFKWPYRYEFLGYDKLRLDFQNPALINWHVYKRIK
jgi:hypothetical protein